MMGQFGRFAFYGAAASWAVFALTLVLGGLSPGSRGRLMQSLSTGASICAVVCCLLAIVALVRGPGRGSAAAGLALALLYVLTFSGLGFVSVG